MSCMFPCYKIARKPKTGEKKKKGEKNDPGIPARHPRPDPGSFRKNPRFFNPWAGSRPIPWK